MSMSMSMSMSRELQFDAIQHKVFEMCWMLNAATKNLLCVTPLDCTPVTRKSSSRRKGTHSDEARRDVTL